MKTSLMYLLIYFTFIIEQYTATWMDEFLFLSVEIFRLLPTLAIVNTVAGDGPKGGLAGQV